MNPSQTTPATSPSASALRIFTRHPRLTIAGLAILGTGMGFRHVSRSYRQNEEAQKKSASNLYVTVDRSGGGI
ncbi:hypothetical protein C8A01DRAFT_32537 [Parachaetomium inaequale]|uniref:Uncharacterized protein n=1 Tax=Parachaetomium inaequale TaxID=2588326 RepID=A0AAN6PR34_9PEZI|nr:hypothetical protein C8A01DRAFT_32537 [Parachaetomium inaequale]